MTEIVSARVIFPLNYGKVYVLRNPYFRHSVVKIGATTRTSETRAFELVKSTGVPGNFEVLYEQGTILPFVAESRIHESLSPYRDRSKKEFFDLPLKLAVAEVHDACKQLDDQISASIDAVLISFANPNTARLLELLAPYRGGDIRVVVRYSNGRTMAQLPLPEDWKLRRDGELFNALIDLQELGRIRIALRSSAESNRLRTQIKATMR